MLLIFLHIRPTYIIHDLFLSMFGVQLGEELHKKGTGRAYTVERESPLGAGGGSGKGSSAELEKKQKKNNLEMKSRFVDR